MTAAAAATATKRGTGRVYSVPAVDKCFRILELFHDACSQLSFTEILQATKIQKTTAFRILCTLETAGYLSKNESTRKYQPALRLVEMSARFLSSQGIVKIIQPDLERLQARFSETACLALRKGDGIEYASLVVSSLSLRTIETVGSPAPLHASALGKAIAAHLAEAELERIVLSQPMERYTDRTITDPRSLREHLKLVRERGYSEDDEEVELGASCLGAAIFSYFGEPLGAISIAGPTTRLRTQRAEMVAALMAAAKDISEKVGLALHICMSPTSAIVRTGAGK